jgi:type II restriction/modification system DNA methylase subunit YeeA
MQQLLNLEKEVIAFARDSGLPSFFPSVGPEQVHGIELDEYAHELATATVWIGYIQWLRDNGFGRPSEPILKPLETVTQMDAILAFDEHENPVEPEWPEADVIVGNPPFLGIRKMREKLDSPYVDALRKLYAGRLPSSVDLICYWFEKAREQIRVGKTKRAGLLATNSIRGGANRTGLKRIKETGNIFFAESDRSWILEGAAVRVSMVGFDDSTEQERTLDGVPAESINADLTSTYVDFSKAQRLPENAGLSFIGTTQAGPFEIDQSKAKAMLCLPSNPNGRSNSEVIKRNINGLDITRRPRHMWTIDFGPDMSLEEAALYEEPFEYVRQHVKPFRDKVRRKRRREKWWLFAETAPGMRKALSSLSRYIATPWVSKHRIFVWIPTSMIPALIVVFARDDDYFFGVLHSRVHEIWAFKMGTWMGAGNDLRYTARSCFETFPLPYSPGQESEGDLHVQAIAEAARELDALRHNWLKPEGASETELKKRTLTNLYNACPTWLENVHKKLDEAVFAAYGWPSDLSDEKVLQNLLGLNLERSKPR